MLNHIDLMGRLARDPELRRTQSGIAVTSIRIAVDRDYSSRDGGERQTDWIDVVAWRGTAEFISKYFTKGSMIVVSGRLQTRDWTDRDGGKRTSVEVVADNVYFGDSKRRDGGNGGSYGGNGGSYNNGGYSGNGGGYSGSGYGGEGNYAPAPIEPNFEAEDDGELPF